jgi:hypothetical protein
MLLCGCCHSCLLWLACLFTVLMGDCPAVRHLPLSEHSGGGGTTLAFSGQLVYLQLRRGSAPLHPHGALHKTATVAKLSPLQGCWAGATAPAFSCWLVYLQCVWGSAPPLSGAHGTTPSLLCVFFFPAACLLFSLFSFNFFPWVGVRLSRGLCWFVPGFSVGVTHATYLLT